MKLIIKHFEHFKYLRETLKYIGLTKNYKLDTNLHLDI